MQQGILNEEEKDIVRDWFDRRQVEPACPICGIWKAEPLAVISPNKYDEEAALVLGGKEWPMIQVVCDHCGYMMLFDARRILHLPDERHGLISK